MKKLILLLFTIFGLGSALAYDSPNVEEKSSFLEKAIEFVLPSAKADVGLVGRSTSLDNLGALQPGSREVFYIHVKNNSGTTYAAGSGMILDYTADDGYSVTGTTSVTARPHCMLQESCANGKLCKCQTYGYTSLLLFDGDGNDVAAAGDPIFASTKTAGYFMALGVGDGSASAESWGVFYDASTASGAVEAFLDLR